MIYIKEHEMKEGEEIDEYEELKMQEDKSIEWFAIVKPITNLVVCLNNCTAAMTQDDDYFAYHCLTGEAYNHDHQKGSSVEGGKKRVIGKVLLRKYLVEANNNKAVYAGLKMITSILTGI